MRRRIGSFFGFNLLPVGPPGVTVPGIPVIVPVPVPVPTSAPEPRFIPVLVPVPVPVAVPVPVPAVVVVGTRGVAKAVVAAPVKKRNVENNNR